MTDKSYPIVIQPLSDEDGGGFVAFAPDLYGCMSDGETPEEALAHIKDAIFQWCDEAKRLGRPLPEPSQIAAPPSHPVIRGPEPKAAMVRA